MTTIKASGRDLELKSDQDIVFYPTSNIWISQGTKLIFEGTVPDDFEVKLQATSVTADRDIILPDASGTMATQEWVNANGGGSYSNSDVDAHLNQSNPTDGYVLSWTSGDYAWVAQSGGGGGSLNDVVDDTTPQLGGNLDLNGNDITGAGNININGDVITTSVGTPTLTSTTDINFTAGTGATDRVEVTQSPFKIASFTTTQRDAKTSEDGDLIYNSSNNQFEIYTNTSWAAMTKVVYDNLLPSSDFVDQITNIWSANPTTPADFATWAQTVASDGYQYGDIDTSGESPDPIRSLDSLHWTNISTNNSPDPAHVTRWLDIVLPSLIEQSWFDVHTSNLVNGNVFSRVSDDTTPKLGGALDADGKNIENLGQVQIGTTGAVVFEGSTDDAFETTLTVVDPTADRTIFFPDATGFVALTTDTTFTGVTTFAQTTEITSDLTGATGVVVHNLNNGAIFDHTSLAADFTANFTNVPTTTNRTISVVLILSQGATAYIPTAVQIDGVAQTILWQGGSAPTGTASGTDVVGFTLIRSSGGAWKIVGSMTGYA